jgi:hypothetical protein
LWDERSADGTYGPLICRAALCGPFGGGGGGGGFDLRSVRNESSNRFIEPRTSWGVVFRCLYSRSPLTVDTDLLTVFRFLTVLCTMSRWTNPKSMIWFG